MLTCTLSLSLTHIYRLSQYLIQLGNARGEAELIITSVFNSGVTGGCCFTVSKAHVNKRAELFKTGDWLARAGSPSHTQIQTCWDNLRKKCLCLSRCKQSKTEPSRSAYHAAGVVNSRDVPADSGVWWSCEEAHVASTRLRGDVRDVYGMTEEFCAAYDQMGMKEENKKINKHISCNFILQQTFPVFFQLDILGLYWSSFAFIYWVSLAPFKPTSQWLAAFHKQMVWTAVGWGLWAHSQSCVPEMTILGISILTDILEIQEKVFGAVWRQGLLAHTLTTLIIILLWHSSLSYK